MKRPNAQRDVPLGLDTLPELKANIGYYEVFQDHPLPWLKEWKIYRGSSIHVARLLACITDGHVY